MPGKKFKFIMSLVQPLSFFFTDKKVIEDLSESATLGNGRVRITPKQCVSRAPVSNPMQ